MLDVFRTRSSEAKIDELQKYVCIMCLIFVIVSFFQKTKTK